MGMMNKMKILFMGTPDFAAVALDAVFKTGEEIVGVVTQPDKPKGRGYTLMPPPVKVKAEELGLPVYQPERVRGEEFAELLSSLSPDLILVVAYGKILPKNVLDFPRYGCINAHASLLPKYRGAAPIQRAIMDGESETGVTAMYMDEGLDTGDMILDVRVKIDRDDNFEVLHDALAIAGAEALTKAIERIKDGTVTRTPQPDGATYAAKIENIDCKIDFSKSASEVHNTVRGLSPIPLSFTHTPDGKLFKLIRTEVAEFDGKAGTAGEVISVKNGKILVACGAGQIYITEAQPEGKRRMSAADIINGRRIKEGDILTNETF